MTATTPAPAAPAAGDGYDAALDLLIDPKVLRDDVSIDSLDLTGEMTNHASLYVFYATKSVRARRQYERWKSALEVLESSLNSTHRDTLAEEFEAEMAADPKSKRRAPTEAQVRARVVTDPKWKSASFRLIEAQEVWKLCEMAERAFEHRKDMLLQIARTAAREQDGPLRVQANRAAGSSAQALLATMAANKGAASTD